MICENCGAKYPDTDIKCSFCGGENPLAAEKKKVEKFEELHQESVEMVKLPEKIVKKSTKRMFRIGFILIGVAILLLASVLVGARMSVNQKHKTRLRDMEKIETLYRDGNYDEMYTFILQSSILSGDSLKYFQVGESYHFYQDAKDALKEEGKLTDDLSFYLLTDCYHGLRTSKEAMEDKAVLGNEELLQTIYHDITEILLNECMLTEDEILKLQELKEPDRQALLPYQNLVEERRNLP